MADVKISWLSWLPFRRWHVVGTVESADEIPERLPRKGVALVGDSAMTKWIVFDCPCRRGHRVMLNADPSRRPRWTLNYSKPVTISPSIDYRGADRRCHFHIRTGRVVWAGNSDR